MLKRLKQIFVTFMAFLTFGSAAPSSQVTVDRVHNPKSGRPDKTASDIDVQVEQSAEQEDAEEEMEEPPPVPSSWQEIAATLTDSGVLRDQLKRYTMIQAERQGIEKFGSIIAEHVGEDYREVIIPKVGRMIDSVAIETDDETLRNLEISDVPSGGFGEKIFHIYDTRNGQDVVRFHVRRDHPPQEGYWFNFHYHLSSDQFHVHHDLGSIYWDKDTPPRWMV